MSFHLALFVSGAVGYSRAGIVLFACGLLRIYLVYRFCLTLCEITDAILVHRQGEPVALRFAQLPVAIGNFCFIQVVGPIGQAADPERSARAGRQVFKRLYGLSSVVILNLDNSLLVGVVNRELRLFGDIDSVAQRLEISAFRNMTLRLSEETFSATGTSTV